MNKFLVILLSSISIGGVASAQTCITDSCLTTDCASDISATKCPVAGDGLTGCLNTYKESHPTYKLSSTCSTSLWAYWMSIDSPAATFLADPYVFSTCATYACLDSACSKEISASKCPVAGDGLTACLNTYRKDHPSFAISQGCSTSLFSYYFPTDSATTVTADYPYLFAAEGAAPPPTGPVPPPQAAAVGFTKLVLNQGGAAGWNIDTNNTGNPGYDWYTRAIFDGKPTPTSEFSVSDGILTLSGNGAYNWQLATAQASTNSNGYVGTVYSNGFYTESSLEIGPGCGSDATGFWADAIEHWHPAAYPSDQWPGQASNYEQWVELDFMESYDSNLTFGILSWFGIYQKTCKDSSGKPVAWCAHGNNNGENNIPWNNQETAGIYGTKNGTIPAGTDVTTKFNTVGALVVPSQLNGGTGYAQGYFNDTKSTVKPNTWSAYKTSVAPMPNGANSFSAADKDHYIIILGARTTPSCTLKVNWVRVWQK